MVDFLINLDKEEFVRVSRFGATHSSSVPQFTFNTSTVLQVLTSVYNSQQANYYLLRTALSDKTGKIPKRKQCNDAIEYIVEQRTTDTGNLLWELYAPHCAGRWAGNRIIHVHNDTVPTLYMTAEQQERLTKRLEARRRVTQPSLADNWVQKCQLATYAHEFFKDITNDVEEQLRAYNMIPSSAAAMSARYLEMFDHRLRSELTGFPDDHAELQFASSRMFSEADVDPDQNERDLGWMTPIELFDFVKEQAISRTALRFVKRWLRCQHLMDWQLQWLREVRWQHQEVVAPLHAEFLQNNNLTWSDAGLRLTPPRVFQNFAAFLSQIAGAELLPTITADSIPEEVITAFVAYRQRNVKTTAMASGQDERRIHLSPDQLVEGGQSSTLASTEGAD